MHEVTFKAASLKKKKKNANKLPFTHFLVNDLEKFINLPPSLKLSVGVSKEKIYCFLYHLFVSNLIPMLTMFFIFISHEVGANSLIQLL